MFNGILTRLQQLYLKVNLDDWIAPEKYNFCSKCGHINSFEKGSYKNRKTKCRHCFKKMNTWAYLKVIYFYFERFFIAIWNKHILKLNRIWWKENGKEKT